MAEDDRITHPLHCDSGGAVELFIEPFTPPLTVVVVGTSPSSPAAPHGVRNLDMPVTSAKVWEAFRDAGLHRP